jgi:hypothetical protein
MDERTTSCIHVKYLHIRSVRLQRHVKDKRHMGLVRIRFSEQN